jgi:hypothetical protein
VVARAFDLVTTTNTVGCPILRVFCEGWEFEMLTPNDFLDQESTTKLMDTCTIATHPCKNARMGHPQAKWCTQKPLRMGHATTPQWERCTQRSSNLGHSAFRPRQDRSGTRGILSQLHQSPDGQKAQK